METPNAFLRLINDDDLPEVFAGLSNPEVIEYYGVSYDSLEAAKSQMDWYRSLHEQQTGLWFALCEKETHVFMGAVGLSNINKLFRKAEIGFWLLPQYWNHGIMFDAAQQVLREGFERLNLHRIEAFIEPANIASEKLLRKLGFEYEGTQRDCEIKNGEFISLKMFAKFAAC
jgi:[ribosomal protein S5]-alanine N-acetyltransferase